MDVACTLAASYAISAASAVRAPQGPGMFRRASWMRGADSMLVERGDRKKAAWSGV